VRDARRKVPLGSLPARWHGPRKRSGMLRIPMILLATFAPLACGGAAGGGEFLLVEFLEAFAPPKGESSG